MVGLVILSVTDDVVTEAPEIAVVVDGLKRGGREDEELDKNTESVKVDVVKVTPRGVGLLDTALLLGIAAEDWKFPMSGWVKTLGAVWINLLRCEPAILVAAGSDLERPFVGSASSTLAAAHTSAADG